MSEIDPGQEFVRLYNELDHLIREISGVGPAEPFWRRVMVAARRNPTVKRAKDDLLEFQELRNAIVHHRGYPETLIAIPTDAAVARLRQIVDRLAAPQLVIPLFARKLQVFDEAAPLREALCYMAQTEFSQIAVRLGGMLRLLTTDAVARWLLSHIAEEPLALGKSTVRDVLLADNRESMALLSQNATVDEARAIFEEAVKRRPRLYAIVITAHGRADEEALGIITPRDLLEEPEQ